MLVRAIKEFPADLNLLDWAVGEFASTSEAERTTLLQKSEAWVLENGEPVMVVGVRRASLIGEAELWMLLCRTFCKNLKTNLREVRELMPLLRAKYPQVQVKIDDGFPAGRKFAEHFGFRRVGDTEFRGQPFGLYEVK